MTERGIHAASWASDSPLLVLDPHQPLPITPTLTPGSEPSNGRACACMADHWAGVPSPSGSCAIAAKASQDNAPSLVASERSAASAAPFATCVQDNEPVLNEITGYMPSLQAWVATPSEPLSEFTKTRRDCRPRPTSFTRWAQVACGADMPSFALALGAAAAVVAAAEPPAAA